MQKFNNQKGTNTQVTKKNQKLKAKCIEHWHEILMILQLNHLNRYILHTDVYINGDGCPFCCEYESVSNILTEGNCEGCPIKMVTGQSSCKGSPWSQVADTVFYNLPYKKCFKAITDEINFLESL